MGWDLEMLTFLSDSGTLPAFGGRMGPSYRAKRSAHMEGQTILSRLKPTTPLDLNNHHTIGDIVEGMAETSFGARMLGEVARTVCAMVAKGTYPPTAIYDGNPDKPLMRLLRRMQTEGYVGEITTSWEFSQNQRRVENALVIGAYAERHEDYLYAHIDHAIYINNHNQCRPGLVMDGFFPDVVFADPSFVLPLLFVVLRERLGGHPLSIDDFIEFLQMEKFGGESDTILHGAHTHKRMLLDPECTVFATFSGAMTIAKTQPSMVDLIETGRIKLVSTTGALVGHGLIEGSQCQHYKYDPTFSDEELAAEGLNRVTDSIEPEGNFDHIEKFITRVLNTYKGRGRIVTCSGELYRRLGEELSKRHPKSRAVLSSAFRMGTRVATPAVIDSEVANDVFVNNARRRLKGLGRIIFDQEQDTQFLFDEATKAKRLGIFTIGGGVPRNNTQNVAPLIEIYNARMKKHLPPGMFLYACRIDPASMFIGNLGGCTYREGGSWRKFDFRGFLAEIRMDATIAWPFIHKFAMERFRRDGARLAA